MGTPASGSPDREQAEPQVVAVIDESTPGASFQWPDERRAALPPPEHPPTAPSPAWEVYAQRAILIAGIIGALAIYFAPLPVGLTLPGKTSIAVFVLCTVLWVTNMLPFGVTGLLAVALLGLTGAMKPNDAFAAFGSSAVFFLIGVFIIGAALVESGLSKRCALLFLRRFESSPYAFANGMMLAAAFGTMWMPNQATSAMLFPIAVEVALALRLRPLHSNYAKVLFLSLGWGAMVGSNASFLGSTRAALALGMLQQTYNRTISFTDWFLAALPVVVLGVAVAPPILRFFFGREKVDFTAARDVLEGSVRAMGPMNRRQWLVAGIVLLTVFSWVTVGGRVDLAVIALLGASLLFMTRVLTWEEAERRIFWNIVLMYGGAIALGVVIDKTGAAKWLVEATVGQAVVAPYMAVAGVVIGTLILSEFMSNAAAVAVMLPLAFSMGDQLGASPVALVLAASIGAGLDFALPFSSAPNTIVFASGYLRMMDVVKAGGLMTIVSVIIVLLVARFWWPILGIL